MCRPGTASAAAQGGKPLPGWRSRSRSRLQLAPDDAWRCPHCKQLQQGSITLGLWTLPDVLIIHLKRFRQVSRGGVGGRPCWAT